MTLLFLPPRVSESISLIEEAARTSGWNVIRLPGWRVLDPVDPAEKVVAYGEPLFVATIAEQLGLSLIEPPFSWLPSLAIKYTKRSVRLTTLGEARLAAGPIFAKPADDKCFTAAVYQSGASITASQLLPANIPVLISDIVQFESEYRFFICDRKIATSCEYFRSGELLSESSQVGMSCGETLEAVDFVDLLLADHTVELPPALVIDVGRISGLGWAVIEANPAFGSGLYRCDPKAVLPVLSRSIVPAGEATVDDAPFVLRR